MSSSRTLFPVLLAAACIAACGEGSTASPAAPAAPVAAAVAAADASPDVVGADGAALMRFANLEFLVVFDAERQLLSVHAPSNLCLPEGAFNTVEVLRVLTPSEIGERLVQVTSDAVRISVYHATSTAEAGFTGDLSLLGIGNLVGDGSQFCAFILGPERIAEGTARRISTFSNASFHEGATGTLQGVDGHAYQLSESYQLNAAADDPFNPATFVERVADVRLKRLP